MSRRVLVTGSRDWRDSWTVEGALYEHMVQGDILVHGACPTGADKFASAYWKLQGGVVDAWPADWRAYGRAAGPMRNMAMIDTEPDLVLAFILNGSPGATGCLDLAIQAGLPRVVYTRTDVHAP